MNAEVVSIGTELLLGQVVDTNSSVISRELASAGVDCYFQTKVGDNVNRIAAALRLALDRSDAVITCGGLGPTQDDITREAIAALAGVELRRDEGQRQRLREIFENRSQKMNSMNERQADVPVGADVIPQSVGTAPGLIYEMEGKVLYALPGVPPEMEDMLLRAVIPDLLQRTDSSASIQSRCVNTWGIPESELAHKLSAHFKGLDTDDRATMAFLAAPTKGVQIRITAKAEDPTSAASILDEQEKELSELLGEAVYGVDDQTIQDAIGGLLAEAGFTLGLAESMTGGLVASHLVDMVGASDWFRGAVVSYASEVKFDTLGLPEGPVVTAEAASAMAEGATRVLKSDVGLGITGVAGPTKQDGMPVGTVFYGLCIQGKTTSQRMQLSGDRDRIRAQAAMWALDILRRSLMG